MTVLPHTEQDFLVHSHILIPEIISNYLYVGGYNIFFGICNDRLQTC